MLAIFSGTTKLVWWGLGTSDGQMAAAAWEEGGGEAGGGDVAVEGETERDSECEAVAPHFRHKLKREHGREKLKRKREPEIKER
jgi:hypothetical protein